MPTKQSNKIQSSGADDNKKFDKKRYYDLKRRVLGWEKDNYTKLAVLDAGGGWYKMFDHSAVIYACQVAKRLKVKAELISDTDFEVTSDAPVLLFRDFEAFEKNLAKIKIKRSSMETGAYTFDLGYKVDAGDLVMMQHENEILRERANKLVLPSEVHPGLRNELRLLSIRMYETSRKMNPTAREMVGDDMVKICARMFVNFVEMANGHADMRQYLKNAVKDLRRLDAMLLLASDLRLFDDSRVYNLMLQVGKVQKKVVTTTLKMETEKNESH